MTAEEKMLEAYKAQIALRSAVEQHIIYAAARSLRSTVQYAGQLGHIAMTLILLEQSAQSEN